MLHNYRNRKDEGFTIIEVLIVLAIAGLILLIVFLAVPALQRNSRNTQRKNDVAALLAGVNDYASNNSGSLPINTTPPTYANNIVTFNNPTAGSPTAQAKVGYYTTGIGAASGDVSYAANSTATAANTFSNAAHDYVLIAPGT
ncbi:MAG: type II secretion system protein, partial [Candidatus Saccharimonadales bacterium]